MLPRNKRRTKPLEVALMLRAMVVASELGSTWGNQKQQDKFSDLLNTYGLKIGSKLQDENSGGSRTYDAQFESFGLIYKDELSNLKLTQAGEDLINFVNPAETFLYQILKFQYPSSYSMGRNVKLDLNVKIRPFLFILQLASDADLQGLSYEDLMIPVVFAKTKGDFELCKSKILQARNSKNLSSVIPDDDSIRTTKTKNNTYKERLKDIKDIANTFKNVLQGVGLINLFSSDDGKEMFKPKSELFGLIKIADELPFVDFENLPKEQAIRRYGTRRGAVKDTRRTFMPSKNPVLFTTESLIYQKFLETVTLPASQLSINEFIEEMKREFKLNPDQILEAIQPIIVNANQYAGARLIELSAGGTKTYEAFEKTIAGVFEFEFGYETEWTGKKRRPNGEVGAYADLFVVEVGRNMCGIIDAKSTANTYDLPHSDVAKMLNTYIPATKAELAKSRNLELKFIAYVSHIIKPGALDRAHEIFKKGNIPVSLISAYELNSMRESSQFKNNPIAVTNRFLEKEVNRLF